MIRPLASHAQSMSDLVARGPGRRRVISLVTALVLAAGLLMIGLVHMVGGGAPPPAHAAGTGDLAVSWAQDGSSVTVVGTGFRANGVVTARVGDVASAQATADAVGAVRIEVPVAHVVGGAVGASVVLTGRSRAGSARTLVSATAPTSAGHGPADLAPWSVAAALAVVAVVTIRNRRPLAANISVERP